MVSDFVNLRKSPEQSAVSVSGLGMNLWRTHQVKSFDSDVCPPMLLSLTQNCSLSVDPSKLSSITGHHLSFGTAETVLQSGPASSATDSAEGEKKEGSNHLQFRTPAAARPRRMQTAVRMRETRFGLDPGPVVHGLVCGCKDR